MLRLSEALLADSGPITVVPVVQQRRSKEQANQFRGPWVAFLKGGACNRVQRYRARLLAHFDSLEQACACQQRQTPQIPAVSSRGVQDVAWA